MLLSIPLTHSNIHKLPKHIPTKSNFPSNLPHFHSVYASVESTKIRYSSNFTSHNINPNHPIISPKHHLNPYKHTLLSNFNQIPHIHPTHTIKSTKINIPIIHQNTDKISKNHQLFKFITE